VQALRLLPLLLLELAYAYSSLATRGPTDFIGTGATTKGLTGVKKIVSLRCVTTKPKELAGEEKKLKSPSRARFYLQGATTEGLTGVFYLAFTRYC